MLDQPFHRWLKIPYTLHVRHATRPKHSRATIVFLHGIGNSGAAWDDVITKLPAGIRVVSVDLLGFGSSPKPKWAVYSAKTQARSVLATLLKLRITSPVIIVGHSLGSLVAIEIAKRYPLVVRSLVLCSPPLYDVSDIGARFDIRPDKILRDLYDAAYKRPDEFVRLSAVAMKYNLISKSFNVTEDNIESYMATLQAMIINQTSLRDAYKLKAPTTIIRGTLDPVVISKNLKRLARRNKNISLTGVLAGHEVKGLFVGAVVKTIKQHLPVTKKHAINK